MFTIKSEFSISFFKILLLFKSIISILIVAIFLYIAFRIIKNCILKNDEFLKLSLCGLASLFIFQTFIHVGVNTSLIPTTGMTLPFLSYGGSSLIGSAILAGITLNYTKIKLEVDEKALIERVVGRFSCGDCGQGYHDKFAPTKLANICDVCGSKNFVRRADDNVESMTARLVAYREQTEPILPYYEKKGALTIINGMKTPEEVFEQIEGVMS